MEDLPIKYTSLNQCLNDINNYMKSIGMAEEYLTYKVFDSYDVLCKLECFTLLMSNIYVNLYSYDNLYIFTVELLENDLNGTTHMYVLIKKSDINNATQIVKDMKDKLNKETISVKRMVNDELEIINKINCKNYKPLMSDFYKDYVKKSEKIKKFSDKDISFNTNLLLTGPPGTGKTKFVTDIAVYLGYDIVHISLEDISSLRRNNAKTIYLIEEIDKQLDHNGNFISDKVNESLVLCFFDGDIRSKQSRLVITCNDKNKLLNNKVLSRRCRLSWEYNFPYINFEQCKHLFNLYYEDVSDSRIEQFYDLMTNKNKMTIAILSEYIQENVFNDVEFDDLDPTRVFDEEKSNITYMYA